MVGGAVLGGFIFNLVKLVPEKYAPLSERLLNGAIGDASTSSFTEPSRIVIYKRNLVSDWLLYILLLLPVLLCFFFIGTYMPNTFEYFTPFKISTWVAAQQSTHNASECGIFPTFSCPEYDTATFKTTSIKLSDFWYLKLFPDNVFLYAFLAVVPLFALTVRSSKSLSLVCSKKVRVNGRFFSVGETFMISSVLLLIALFAYYWLHDHNYNGYWPSSTTTLLSEIVYRAFGQIAVLLMSLLLFPAARSSLLTSIFGTSWEMTIQYHRWLGVSFLVFVFLHMFAVWVWQAQNKKFSFFSVPLVTLTTLDNFTVPMQTLVAWLVLLAMGVGALETVRRKHFEVFYYSHHVAYCVLIPSVLWHAAASWQYLLPGLTVWFVDRCVRAYRSSKAIRHIEISAEEYGAAGGMTILRLEQPFSYYPGQYAFVNIPELSLFQWHPFTISSSGTEFSFHIKEMGVGTWTRALYEAVEMRKQLTISVDGPCGAPIDYTQYTTVILVAGGIGVTPCKSVFESLRATSSSLGALIRVHLIWAGRDESLFSIMSDSLHDLPLPNPSETVFTASLFIDNPAAKAPSVTADSHLDPEQQAANLSKIITYGRVNLQSEFAKFQTESNLKHPDHTLVFVCGPPGLTSSCETLCAQYNWSFHSETFAL